MATFKNLQDELDLLTNSQITLADRKSLINLAHMQEVEAHPWHRRKTNVVISTVAPYSTGTVTVASGSTALTGTGTVWTAAMTGRAMRIGNDDALIGFTQTGATTGTLATAWPGADQTAVAYSIFPQFYTVATGCDQVLAVTRTTNLDQMTVEEFNRMDPARRATGSPSTRWAPAGRTASDLYQIELWPIETSANAYVVEYLRGHVDLVADADRPLVTASVIQFKSQFLGSIAMLSKTGDGRWQLQATTALALYKEELDKALIQDRKAYGVIQQIQDVLRSQVFLDPTYIATHDTWG